MSLPLIDLAPLLSEYLEQRMGGGFRQLRGLLRREALDDEHIHSFRRGSKRLRALLVLTQDSSGVALRASLDALRDAAAALAERRRQRVLGDLLRSGLGPLPPAPPGLLAEWEAWQANASGAAAEPWLERARNRLDDSHQAWKLIDLPPIRRSALGDGLRRQYRRARRQLQVITVAAPATAFHDWRRHSRRFADQLYGLPLLIRADSSEKAEFGQLHDLLGQHHDLEDLHAWLKQRPVSQRSDWQLQLEATQLRLASEALALGQRLYARRPRELRDTLVS